MLTPFQSAIETFFAEFPDGETAFCNEFSVSPGTIKRWRSGKTAPGEYVQGVIVERITGTFIPRLQKEALQGGEHESH